MPTNHVTQQIEAYLENRLSNDERRRVEEHLIDCPACAYRLYNARRITNELSPLLKKTLGQPLPPSALQQRVRQAVTAQQSASSLRFPWALSGRIINAAGTLAVVGVLSYGILTIIQSQSVPPETNLNQPALTAGTANIVSTTGTASVVSLASTGQISTPISGQTLRPLPAATNQPSNSETSNSFRETLEIPPGKRLNDDIPKITVMASPGLLEPTTAPFGPSSKMTEVVEADDFSTTSPPGKIAFTFFNPTSKVYEIHLIDADGTNQQRFPLDGVSEPALTRTEQGTYQLAYRAWGEPTTPRSLLVNNISAEQPLALTNFWEDAQPDWSPTEPRLIFASQRESDRRWRLYTVWQDGSAEKDLRREGKAPSFAPDGYRFAFEGCDQIQRNERCGLWIGDLENSEQNSQPVLLDEWAQAPDWSPVGEEIVYMANSDNNWDLYLTDSSGRPPRRLTNDPAADGLPVWSPDGQWLAFLSNRDNHWGIWLLEKESLELQPLVTLEEGHFSPPQRAPYEERHWWDEQLSWSN